MPPVTVQWQCTAQAAELTITVQAPTASRATELALAVVQAFVIERAHALGWTPLAVSLVQL